MRELRFIRGILQCMLLRPVSRQPRSWLVGCLPRELQGNHTTGAGTCVSRHGRFALRRDLSERRRTWSISLLERHKILLQLCDSSLGWNSRNEGFTKIRLFEVHRRVRGSASTELYVPPPRRLAAAIRIRFGMGECAARAVLSAMYIRASQDACHER